MILFVPLKKESQRVPGKNFRQFGELPLYKHVLMKYKDFSVFVDTDSPDVLKMIKEDKDLQHVEVYLRKEVLKGHDVSVNLLIRDLLERKDCSKEPIAQIHVTNPFLEKGTLEKACSAIQDPNYDSVVSVDVIRGRCWRTEGVRAIPINHNPGVLEQTQDINPVLFENSCFYIFSEKSFIDNGYNRLGKKPMFFEVSHPENKDIDTEEDWDECCRVLKWI